MGYGRKGSRPEMLGGSPLCCSLPQLPSEPSARPGL
jgi:hypothetical protein